MGSSAWETSRDKPRLKVSVLLQLDLPLVTGKTPLLQSHCFLTCPTLFPFQTLTLVDPILQNALPFSLPLSLPNGILYTY